MLDGEEEGSGMGPVVSAACDGGGKIRAAKKRATIEARDGTNWSKSDVPSSDF